MNQQEEYLDHFACRNDPVVKLADVLCHKPIGHLADVERKHIIRVLEQTHWKVGGTPQCGANPGHKKKGTLRARMRKLLVYKP